MAPATATRAEPEGDRFPKLLKAVPERLLGIANGSSKGMSPTSSSTDHAAGLPQDSDDAFTFMLLASRGLSRSWLKLRERVLANWRTSRG